MITSITNRHGSNTYWNIVKHLSPDAKVELINMLSQSLRDGRTHKVSAKKHYGVWGDDGMTDEEFVADLKAMRSFKQDIVEI